MHNTIQEQLHDAGLNAILRTSAPEDYAEAAHEVAYCPVAFTPSNIEYQVEYYSGNGVPTVDLSLTIKLGHEICGIWPLSISRSQQTDNPYRVGSNGGPILPPLFLPQVSVQQINKLTKKCFVFLQRLCMEYCVEEIISEDPFLDTCGLSVWQKQLLQNGGIGGQRYYLFRDLSHSLTHIESTFRKSLRSSIRQAAEHWKATVCCAVSSDHWREFQNLHREVSGRVTRSQHSWDLQRNAINSGSSFFVDLRDAEDKMIGGLLYSLSGQELRGAVGAYDRALFDRPIAHLAVFTGLREGLRRGLRWYSLGRRYYSFESPAPSKKEISISKFKQGFASHLVPLSVCSIRLGS